MTDNNSRKAGNAAEASDRDIADRRAHPDLLLWLTPQSGPGLKEHVFPRGTCFLQEGKEPDAVFVIVEGTAKLFRLLADGRCQVVAFCGPGDLLGFESERFGGCGAEALEDVRVASLPRRRLQAMVDSSKALQKRLLEWSLIEIQTHQDHMVILGKLLARQRVAGFLMHMANNQRRWGQPANPVRLPMTRADIGDFLGLTLETVSRTLSGFEREGLIASADANCVILCEPEELARLARGTTS